MRGPVLDKAMEVDRRLKEGKEQLPFDEIIYCNIGGLCLRFVSVSLNEPLTPDRPSHLNKNAM